MQMTYSSMFYANSQTLTNWVSYLSDIERWMSQNILKFNNDKSKVILFGPTNSNTDKFGAAVDWLEEQSSTNPRVSGSLHGSGYRRSKKYVLHLLKYTNNPLHLEGKEQLIIQSIPHHVVNMVEADVNGCLSL